MDKMCGQKTHQQWVISSVRLVAWLRLSMWLIFWLIFWLIITVAAMPSLTTSSIAAPITVTTLSHHSEPQYADAAHMPYANPDAPKGGTLSLSAFGTFNTTNAFINQGTPASGVMNLYDTLMTGSLDESFTMYPQLAEKVTYDPEDASWIIYHINPQARFWNGEPVTASDVEATFAAILSKGLMSWRSYLSDIDRVEALDSQRVKFTFKSADNQEIGLTVGQMPIFAKSDIERRFEQVSMTPLMGSGAYQLGRVDAGRSITYVRDRNYWGAAAEAGVMANRGRFNFDAIRYVYYQSDEIAFEGFKSGQYRFRVENKARNWAMAYDFPAVHSGQVVRQTITNSNPVAMQGIVMNLRRPLFADIRVRQALTYAFDFEWMNKALFYGQYERLQSYFYGSELAATGTPNAAEMAILQPLLPQLEPIQRQAVLSDWHLPSSDGTGFNRAGLLQARQLLLQAGFYYQDMRLYQPDGTPAQLEILMTGDTMARVLLPYIRNLNRLGFAASLRQVDAPQYLERTRRFDFDMTTDVFAQSLSPGAEQSYMWGSQAADEVGNMNSAGIKNPAIDSVVAGLMAAQTREDVVLYTHVLDRLLRAGFYIVPMYGSPKTRVAYWQEYRHPDRLPHNAVGTDYWWVDATDTKN